MPDRSHSRISPEQIAADRAILSAALNLTDYSPMNGAYSLATLQELEATMVAAQQAEERIRLDADAARDRVIAACHAFDRGIKGLRVQIRAQYGDESVALHAVGLKKRSERKRPTRRQQVEA